MNHHQGPTVDHISVSVERQAHQSEKEVRQGAFKLKACL